jgi:hypothetical protein
VLADRVSYGDTYLPKGDCGWDKAALLLRFMHEGCRIPLWQARQCAIAIIQCQEAYHVDGSQPAEVATQLAEEDGNVLIAETTASLYIAAAEGTACEPLWREVFETLRCGGVIDDEEEGAAEWGARKTLH